MSNPGPQLCPLKPPRVGINDHFLRESPQYLNMISVFSYNFSLSEHTYSVFLVLNFYT